MSGKRRADNQVTRENLHQFENNDDDDSIPQGPSRATADVLSKRKILKPRSRLNRGGDSGSNGSTTNASSSGFSFGTSNGATSDSNAGSKPNPFSGFGKPIDNNNNNTNNNNNKPTFSFGTKTEEQPKSNPFQFLGNKNQESEAPKQNVFSFLNNSNNNNNNNNNNNSLTKTTTNTSNTDLITSSKSSINPNKVKALNDNFYDKLTQERQINPISNFTPILKKYMNYYERIENDDYLPDADEEPQQKQIENNQEQKSLPAPSAPSTSSASSFSFGNNNEQKAITNTTIPSFSFGSNKPIESSESSRIEKEPTPMDESNDTQNQSQSQQQEQSQKDEVIKVDSSSDSDSDDEIKVEGPKFTITKPPTTTDSVFKFDTTSTSTTNKSNDIIAKNSNSNGPSFTFKVDSTKKFESPFKLSKDFAENEKQEESKINDKKIGEIKSSTNNFSWSPDKPIKFTDNETKKNGNEDGNISKPTFTFGNVSNNDKPAFTFGNTSEKKEQNDDKDNNNSNDNDSSVPNKPSFSFGETTKPTFSFGKSNTSNSIEEKKSTPSFSFGSTSTKPTFSFGQTNTSNDDKPKPTFSFGQTNTSNDDKPKPSFSFGQTNTSNDDKPKPSFNFGDSNKPAFSFGNTTGPSSSSSFNFSFSGNKSESKEESTKSNDDNNNNKNDDDDKVQEEEVEGNFKPIVKLTEQVEKKTGEEDEENLFTKRSKLMLFNPKNKEQPYESKGLGELKILQNKENKKSRILIRSDGANRILLNTAISKNFKYETIGKGDTVRIPTINTDGKIETYIVRVKTPEDGNNLLSSLKSVQ